MDEWFQGSGLGLGAEDISCLEAYQFIYCFFTQGLCKGFNNLQHWDRMIARLEYK